MLPRHEGPENVLMRLQSGWHTVLLISVYWMGTNAFQMGGRHHQHNRATRPQMFHAYQETASETKLRHLWELNPFQNACMLVERFIRNDSSSSIVGSSLLVKIQNIISMLQTDTNVSSISTSLSELKYTSSRRYRSYRLDLAYDGRSFCGWQRQADQALPSSVQQQVEDALETIVGHSVNVRVCGRTDRGVHALGQVARVRTWHPTLTADKLFANLGAASNPNWRCWRVKEVSDKFHPTFGATHRSYLYVMDAAVLEQVLDVNTEELAERLNRQLSKIVGLSLDYFACSSGKLSTNSTVCRMEWAQVFRVRCHDTVVVGIALRADRFLRRMVRILVASAMQMAIENQEDDALWRMIQSGDRTLSSAAAPAEGLIFTGGNFEVE